eukprot:jgi/Ulvmu1/10779/UM069_0013.1
MAGVEKAPRDGESMVKKHHDKLQAEKEAAGIAKLQATLPELSKPVLAYALQDSQLDAEKALLVLRQFQSESFDELSAIQRRRKDLRARGRGKSRRRTSVSPVSGSESESSEDRRRERSRKSKHKKSSKHSREKSKKDKHRKHKKEKRSKRSRHSPREDDDMPSKRGRPLEFGSFGIIREADYTAKRPEFAAWASEVKNIDIESLPRGDERDLFREFLEDFNTCTFPHRKFYDLAAYTRTHGGAASLGGGPGGGEGGTVDDERQRRTELQAERKAREDASARELMSRMVLSRKQVSELKQREMMRLRAQEAYKTGDMSTAAKLMKQLRPVEEGGARNEGDEF